MLDGIECNIPTPIPERELFGLLGGDFVLSPEKALATAV
jgi:hypothetical protein